MNPDPIISVLSDSLANQIAAGEVVTRPASVVKELVENALDAGATSITIDVVEGGTQLIRVVDDGHGMSAANAQLCVRRHATSKIGSAEDLLSIDTLGFRGEALPSIASVSRFRLTTRPADEEGATEVWIEGGNPESVTAASGAIGTRIEVSDLFYNVPARRKFLKTVATEFSQIKKLVLALALGFPYVRLQLTHNGRTALQFTPARNLRERAFQVFGKKTASSMHPVEATAPIQLHGLISEASTNRASRAGIYAFVNGRFVRDRVITHALVSAYSDQLPKGRFPEAVLYVHLPADEVDVNTHPTKEEIRFSHPGAIHQTIASAVANTLRSEPWLLVPRPKREERPRIEPLFQASSFVHPHRFEPEPLEPLQPAPVSDVAPPPPAMWALIGQTSRGDAVVEEGQAIRIISRKEAIQCIASETWLSGLEEGRPLGRPLLFPEQIEMDVARSEVLKKYAPDLHRIGYEVTSFGGLTWQCSELPEALAGQSPRAMVEALADGLLGIRGDLQAHIQSLIRRVAQACEPQDEATSTEIAELIEALGNIPPTRRAQWSLGPSLPYTPKDRG